MRVLVTGGKGMLGRTLSAELQEFDLFAADRRECDVTDPAGFEAVLKKFQPQAVIHCAAMTAVDLCETESEQAYKINAYGSGVAAAACARNGVRLIAVSTDYVFDGSSDRPYNEFDQADGGRTIYGKSKFAGEELIRRHCPDHLICRVSWLYGAGGPSFVHTMMKLADGSRPFLKVVDDQRGNPTSCLAVARKMRELLNRTTLAGTFHLTCEGEASWAEFAKEIFRLGNAAQQIQPCTTGEFPRPAPRPANSRLDKMMLRLAGLSPMPHWKEALEEFMKSEFC